MHTQGPRRLPRPRLRLLATLQLRLSSRLLVTGRLESVAGLSPHPALRLAVRLMVALLVALVRLKVRHKMVRALDAALPPPDEQGRPVLVVQYGATRDAAGRLYPVGLPGACLVYTSDAADE